MDLFTISFWNEPIKKVSNFVKMHQDNIYQNLHDDLPLVVLRNWPIVKLSVFVVALLLWIESGSEFRGTAFFRARPTKPASELGTRLGNCSARRLVIHVLELCRR